MHKKIASILILTLALVLTSGCDKAEQTQVSVVSEVLKGLNLDIDLETLQKMNIDIEPFINLTNFYNEELGLSFTNIITIKYEVKKNNLNKGTVKIKSISFGNDGLGNGSTRIENGK